MFSKCCLLGAYMLASCLDVIHSHFRLYCVNIYTQNPTTAGDCFPVEVSIFLSKIFLGSCMYGNFFFTHVVGSAAEDKVVFPAVDRKVKQQVSYITDHADEERKFIEVRRLLEGVQAALEQNTTAAELYGELCLQAEVIVETIQQHLLDEEDQVR